MIRDADFNSVNTAPASILITLIFDGLFKIPIGYTVHKKNVAYDSIV